jgi:dienelactone hydrolase
MGGWELFVGAAVAWVARDSRRNGARAATVMVVTLLGLVSACAGAPLPHAVQPAKREVSATPRPTAVSRDNTAEVGLPGSYQIGRRQVTFTEPGHIGPTGENLGARVLVTVVQYPVALRSDGQAVRGPFPVLLFAPGFMQCGGPYSDLLHAWASAGYVVATVNFPRTDCSVGTAADEADLVNQPADMSYVLTRLLALSAQPQGWFSGLVNRDQIGVTGQSDGGDTVAALAANACCTDHRVRAVAVLSGAEWPPMTGRYFPSQAPPMLFVQGTADTINPPWMSLQLYQADAAGIRYYLDLFGANHTGPYWGMNPAEQLVVRVTLAFLDRYVLGQAGALAVMARDGTVAGAAALVSDGRLPP